MQDVQLELAALDAGRKIAQVADLLPREPGGVQICVLGAQELGWRRQIITEEGDEAGVDCAGRLRGELLPHDGAHEGAVGVVGTPTAASRVVERADAFDERGHDRVATREQKAKARVLGGVRGLSGFGFDLLPAEEELGGRAHHLRVPHRLEGELGVHRLDALDAQSFGLDLLLDQITHRTHGAREGEGHVHVAPFIVDAHIVDQTELHEVHPDLGVYDIPQLIPHTLLGYHRFTSCLSAFVPHLIVSARPAFFSAHHLAQPLLTPCYT
jgi:hypothetical protein